MQTTYITSSNCPAEGEMLLNFFQILFHVSKYFFRYNLSSISLHLWREEDDLIFDADEDYQSVHSPHWASHEAFGYLKNKKFFGQFHAKHTTFFIDDPAKIGESGLGILYSLEDATAQRSSTVQTQEWNCSK